MATTKKEDDVQGSRSESRCCRCGCKSRRIYCEDCAQQVKDISRLMHRHDTRPCTMRDLEMAKDGHADPVPEVR